jgi:hypothetical protein
MHPVQMTGTQGVVDRVASHPGPNQLSPRHHTVLPLCHLDNATP